MSTSLRAVANAAPSKPPGARALLSALTLSVATLAAPGTAQAQVLDPLWLALNTAANGILTPTTVGVLAVNPLLWNAIFAAAGPTYAPYAAEARKVALSLPARLKPVPEAPQPVGQPLSHNFSQIVSFGDSMSDTGNMFAITQAAGGLGLPAAPNDRGRFSNGPVVMEVLRDRLSIPMLNYAVGGGQSGRGNLLPLSGLQIGTLKQIDDFIANQPNVRTPVDARALYVIWTGPDDLLMNIFSKTIASTVVNNIKTGMTTLYNRGARQFFVPLMPDLSITPSARIKNKNVPGYLLNSHTRSAELAKATTAMLQAFAKQYPQAQVRTFDTYTYSISSIAQASAEGKNTTEACYTPPIMGLPGPVCATPDQHLFWDEQHPTAAGAQVIGTAMALGAVSAPLSSR
jgi:phospholipase/lecithinase/hemolysin